MITVSTKWKKLKPFFFFFYYMTLLNWCSIHSSTQCKSYVSILNEPPACNFNCAGLYDRTYRPQGRMTNHRRFRWQRPINSSILCWRKRICYTEKCASSWVEDVEKGWRVRGRSSGVLFESIVRWFVACLDADSKLMMACRTRPTIKPYSH